MSPLERRQFVFLFVRVLCSLSVIYDSCLSCKDAKVCFAFPRENAFLEGAQ
jgi:hypothetical protein